MLESEEVKMTIEVLNDGKDNRAFRALNIKCWINWILSLFYLNLFIMINHFIKNVQKFIILMININIKQKDLILSLYF